MNCRIFLILIVFQFLSGCHSSYPIEKQKQFSIDSAKVLQYIREGNKIYATHSGIDAFAKSMRYYDSAWQIAQKTEDSFLLGVSLFAKGRAYDAWNNEPEMTIKCFEQSAQLYKNLPNRYDYYLYINELKAHAYEKKGDSANAIHSLQFIYDELVNKSDSLKQIMNFIPQMATVSTDVKNYLFAEKVLNDLYQRAWIKNEPESYNYLDYYYLAMSRIEVYQYKKTNSPYLDSFENVYLQCKNLSDSTYYLSQLQELYAAVGNSKKKYFYTQEYEKAFAKYNNPVSIASFQKSLNEIEKASMLKQMSIEKKRLYTQTAFLWILGSLLIIITSLGIFLYRRNKEIALKQDQLFSVNKELSHKNLQNELLNKELHHRVKNNLQMILSLIYMQERSIKTDEAKQNLQEIRLRIESIATLHRQLIDQESDWVDLKKYVSQMLHSVISLVGEGNNVITHLEIENFPIPTNVSFPLGLILNELFTNSIKYASRHNGILELFLQIEKRNDDVYISYHDSGAAVEQLDVNSGLGLKIIQLLCSQINATIKQSSDNYFDYTFTIPYGS